MDIIISSVDNPTTSSVIWDEIERSESFLVCCMFSEAASLASSVLRRLCDNECTGPTMEIIEFNDMLESAGMVFVQSLKELGRTLEILKELKLLFGSVTAIPIRVFLTGICFQIEEGSYDVREFLEEFLSMWRCVDDRYYVLASVEENTGNLGGYDNPFVIGIDKYLEVVEVYVVTLLAKLLRDIDLAISWVEKAALPEKKRQELLRQLQSIYSDKITSLSQANCSPVLADQNRTHTAVKEQNMHEGFHEAQNPSIGNTGAKEASMNLSKQKAPCFWWFRTITLKFGNGRLVISNGSILLGCLLFLMYFSMRRKQANLKRLGQVSGRVIGCNMWNTVGERSLYIFVLGLCIVMISQIFGVANLLPLIIIYRYPVAETSSVCKEGGDGLVSTRILIPSEPSCCCSTPPSGITREPVRVTPIPHSRGYNHC